MRARCCRLTRTSVWVPVPTASCRRADWIASRSWADVTTTLEPLALVASLWPKRSTSVSVTDERGSSVERVARGSLLLMPTSGAVELKIDAEPALASAPALAIGVVVDARGRPLELPPRDAERLPTLGRWHAALATLPVGGGVS